MVLRFAEGARAKHIVASSSLSVCTRPSVLIKIILSPKFPFCAFITSPVAIYFSVVIRCNFMMKSVMKPMM